MCKCKKWQIVLAVPPSLRWSVQWPGQNTWDTQELCSGLQILQSIQSGIMGWPHCTTLHWPTQLRRNQRCDIGDLGYSLFMGGKCPLFSRTPNVFRLLILVSGKDNECQVPASSERKSLDVRLLIIQNIDSWMEPTVFTSPRRFRLRKTPEPSPAQHRCIHPIAGTTYLWRYFLHRVISWWVQSGPSTHHHQQSPIGRRIWTLSVCAVTGCSGCGGVTYCAYLALIFIDTHHRSEGGGGGTCLLLVAAWLVTMSALSDPLTPDYKACKPERSWAGVLYTAAGTKGYLARRRRRLCSAGRCHVTAGAKEGEVCIKPASVTPTCTCLLLQGSVVLNCNSWCLSKIFTQSLGIIDPKIPSQHRTAHTSHWFDCVYQIYKVASGLRCLGLERGAIIAQRQRSHFLSYPSPASASPWTEIFLHVSLIFQQFCPH